MNLCWKREIVFVKSTLSDSGLLSFPTRILLFLDNLVSAQSFTAIYVQMTHKFVPLFLTCFLSSKSICSTVLYQPQIIHLTIAFKSNCSSWTHCFVGFFFFFSQKWLLHRTSTSMIIQEKKSWDSFYLLPLTLVSHPIDLLVLSFLISHSHHFPLPCLLISTVTVSSST